MPKGSVPLIPQPLPEWFSVVADNSLLSAKDLGKLFGITASGAYRRAAIMDDFPQALHPGLTTCWRGRKIAMARWRARDIRAWIKKRVAEGRFTV